MMVGMANSKDMVFAMNPFRLVVHSLVFLTVRSDLSVHGVDRGWLVWGHWGVASVGSWVDHGVCLVQRIRSFRVVG